MAEVLPQAARIELLLYLIRRKVLPDTFIAATPHMSLELHGRQMGGVLLQAATIILYTYGSSHTEYFTRSYSTGREVREKMFASLLFSPLFDLHIIRRR